ncbi:MAG: VTC domain-containing protein [Saprospiraceae bacterium]|nr:VTC domain-containing protein [Saprospiraceae bacterium]
MGSLPDISDQLRFERKYRLEHVSLAFVLQVIQNHPASFSTLYPDRQINNVYYDRPDFSGYKLNLMGVGFRRKYRLRWYGPNITNLDSAQLEIKQRENELGSKLIRPIQNLNWVAVPKLFDTEFPQQAPLRPTLINTYLRSYFGARHGRFRITIDREQQFLPLLDRPLPDASWLAGKRFPYQDEALVLELKYDAPFDQEAQEIMQFLPFRQGRNSKYVNGVTYVL